MNGESLCLEKTLVRAASLLQFLSSLEKEPRFDSSLIVGNPWPHHHQKDLIYELPGEKKPSKIPFLSGALEEAGILEHTLPHPTLLLGNDATGEQFLEKIKTHSLIHFSGHGSLGRILFLSGPFKGFPPPFEPKEFSDLRKKERTGKTRNINMMEEWHPVTDVDLIDKPLAERAIVFLNACETGKHKYERGGYYQGLSAAFLKNGAHSVISSLIPIFEEPSKDFAVIFYEELLKTRSVSKSLKKARISVKETYKSEIHWIPYLHYGSPF